MSTTADATSLLQAWRRGDNDALNGLMALLYQELRRIAHQRLAGQRRGHTLQTTALVHEAYIKLIDCRDVGWRDRTHFLAVSANLMRRILVDYARAHNAGKRGGGLRPASFDENIALSAKSLDLVALDDALTALSGIDPRKSKVVELKFFGGLETDEIAEVVGVSAPTVLRDWKLAKVWLLREVSRA